MNLTPIRDLVQKTRQIDPKKLGRDAFVYVDISSVDKDTKRITAPQTLSVDDAPSRARKDIKANDVLVATVRPNLNGVAMVSPEYDSQIASTGFCVLRADTEQIDPNYLFYFTQTDYFVSHLTDLSTGAGYPAVSDDDILDTQIPLPPLSEQKRIAALLARADRLRQLRRAAHELGESLLQSVFLEMFGDVRINDKKWELARFEDVCESRLGKMLDDKKQTGKHKRQYLRNFNVQWHRLDLSDIAEMDFDEKDRKEFRLEYGDILICEGGEVGRATIWRNEIEECYFQKALHRARPNPELAYPEYIVYLLEWMARTGGLGDFTSQVTIAHLTGEKLKELVIPVPPLSEQAAFAGVVARIEALRRRMSEAGRQVEGLFESLLAEAFT